MPAPKRQRKSEKSQSQKSQRMAQFPGIDANDNEFYKLMSRCKVRFQHSLDKPHELDMPETIEFFLQQKLQRNDKLQKQFKNSFEEFMELNNGKRLKQALLPTIPRKNNRFVFISEAWKNMSQINENDVNIPSTRKQPSIIRILLNVDCLQPHIILFLQEKLDDYIGNEEDEKKK
eukprot:555116_1